jgi:hypothetical protein
MTAPIPWPGKQAQTLAEGEADRFPIVVAEWPRNNRELVRIALDRFKDCLTVDMRSWWKDTDGIFRPGRDGLTLAVKHLPKLAEGLDKALQRAEMLGLVHAVSMGGKDRTAAERQRRYRQRRNGANGHCSSRRCQCRGWARGRDKA